MSRRTPLYRRSEIDIKRRLCSFAECIRSCIGHHNAYRADRLFEEALRAIKLSGDVSAESIQAFCRTIAKAHAAVKNYPKAISVAKCGLNACNGDRKAAARILASVKHWQHLENNRTKKSDGTTDRIPSFLHRLKVAQENYDRKILSTPLELCDELKIETRLPQMDSDLDSERRALTRRWSRL